MRQVVRKIEGNYGVEVYSDLDDSIQLLTTKNEYQWNGLGTDIKGLKMIQECINEFLEELDNASSDAK